MAWLSVDAGTSVIKAVLITNAGEQVAVARASVGVRRILPGFAEQDMNEVWRAVVATSCEVLKTSTEALAGIVTTAQGDGVWLVDHAGMPLGDAILWNDGRAAQGGRDYRFDGLQDVPREAFALSGSVPYAGLPCAIWPWLEEHEPERLRRARWSLTCNGWLHAKLTGNFVADLSDASNPFVDLRTRTYADRLLALHGVQQHAHLLPPIAGGFAPMGTLTASAAAELSLVRDVVRGLPVVMAPYDIVSMAVGAGSVEPGEGCLILGTTMCAETFITSPAMIAASNPAGTTLALAGGTLLRAMPTLTGCEALDWTAALLGLDSLNELSLLAASAPAGADNLVFLPYLSPAGERAPFLAAEAKGSFHGLSLVHQPRHLARAVYEGLSFAARECLEAACHKGPQRLTVCGGGARSDLWCQLLADVVGCTVLRTTVGEVGAQGAFFHAQVAAGLRQTLRQAIDSGPHSATTFLPDARQRALYNHLYHRFLVLRDQAAVIWQLMCPDASGAGLSKEPQIGARWTEEANLARVGKEGH